MTLRIRLLLGYGYLVALLLLAVGGAMLGFLNLSDGIDLVLEENLKSIEASMRMSEALERQDSATLAALIEGQTELEEMEGFEKDFQEGLAIAEGNVTEEAEKPVVVSIGQHFAEYREARDELLIEQPAQPLAEYNRRVFPLFAAVKGDVLQLLAINQDAMVEADRAARATAVRNGAWLGFLATVALVSLVLLSRALQRRVLSRLAELKEGMAAITYGDPTRRVREEGDDELAAIARHFNRLLDQRQELESRLEGRLAQERRLVLGLMAHLGPGAALHDLSGERLAGGRVPGGGSGKRQGGVEAWIREEGRGLLVESAGYGEPVAREVDLGGGRRATVHLLTAGAGRPVGWLVLEAAVRA